MGVDSSLLGKRNSVSAMNFICAVTLHFTCLFIYLRCCMNQARIWTLSIGFTISFGAVFSKTWRVHTIFTNVDASKRVIQI